MILPPEVWIAFAVVSVGIGYVLGLGAGIQRERARLRAALLPRDP